MGLNKKLLILREVMRVGCGSDSAVSDQAEVEQRDNGMSWVLNTSHGHGNKSWQSKRSREGLGMVAERIARFTALALDTTPAGNPGATT